MTAVAVPESMSVVGVSAPIAAAIRRVYDAHGQENLPANVLKAAKIDEDLHALFEWDNKKAGEAFRLEQAAQLVRRVKVRLIRADPSDPITVRAYIARRELPAKDEADVSPGAYVAIEEIAGLTESEAAISESIKRDLLRVQRKYTHVRDYFLSVARDVIDHPDELED